MTNQEIVDLAREAGLWIPPVASFENGALMRFATLVAEHERERVMQIVQSMKADLEAKFEESYMEGVMAGAAAEREACAKLCENQDETDTRYRYDYRRGVLDCADAIRSRGNT